MRPKKTHNIASSLDLRTILLVISIVLFYILFQLIFVFTSTAGLDGSCMYAFWLPENQWWQNPFWLVAAIVAGMLLLSLFMLADGYTTRTPIKMVAGLVATVFLGLWLNSLHWLWQAMLYEQGALTAEHWFSANDSPGLIITDAHVCTPPLK